MNHAGQLPHLREKASGAEVLLAVSAMTLILSGMVFAQAETPVIDQRQMYQEPANR